MIFAWVPETPRRLSKCRGCSTPMCGTQRVCEDCRSGMDGREPEAEAVDWIPDEVLQATELELSSWV